MSALLRTPPGLVALARPFTVTRPKMHATANRPSPRLKVHPEGKQPWWPAQAAWLLCCGGTQLALPATAAAADVGKLFDIDATLPIVMLQVLLLTFLLDRILFGPVGRHLDARKVALDGKRADAKRLAARAAEFKKDAEEIMAQVEKEIQEKVDAAVKEIKEEHEARFEASKKEMEEERRRRLEELHADSSELAAQLEEQAAKISEEILDKLLPKGLR